MLNIACLRKASACRVVAASLLLVGYADGVTIRIVADNDFAVYAGTATGITREIYQNGVVWNTQISAASSFSFDLLEGENTFYVLAMGGGGQENISGQINGVNIVSIFRDDPNAIKVSSNVNSFFTGYQPSAGGSVESGVFSANFAQAVAAASAPGTTWGAPTEVSGQTVINANPYALYDGANRGFSVPDGQARFFRFSSSEVGLSSSPVPEVTPSGLLAGVMGLGTMAYRRRRRSK